MISHHDIAAMDNCGYTTPRCETGNTLLELLKVIKGLEAYIDTGATASIGLAEKWNVPRANRQGAGD